MRGLICLIVLLALAGCGVGPREEWYFLVPGTTVFVVTGPFVNQSDCDEIRGALPASMQRHSSRCWRGR